MKVIVTGATGTVGSAVLARCLQHPAITSVVSLGRRPLDTQHPKLQHIISTDFLKYDQDTLSQLKGAEACIWALGTPTAGKEVHRDYTMAAVNAFLTTVIPESQSKGKKFRFVYTSGGAVPLLESNALFFLGSGRTLRAEVDREVMAIETRNPEIWQSYVVRPWFVVDVKPMIGNVVSNSYVYRNELGAAMVDLALNGGGGGGRVVDNAELRKRGQAALDAVR